MSYARWSEGDVYVYADVFGGIICMCCLLMPIRETPSGKEMHQHLVTDNAEDMITHLRQHQDAGHCVPARAFEGLERDIAEGVTYEPCKEAIELDTVIEENK